MSSKKDNLNSEYTVFLLTRVAIGILAAIAIVWGVTALFAHFGQPVPEHVAATEQVAPRIADKP